MPLSKLPLSPAARAWLPVRLLLAVGASVGVAFLLVLVLYITDLGLSVWERLQQRGPVFWMFYLLILGGLSMGGAYGVWRVMHWGRPASKSRPTAPPPPPDEATLRQRLEHSEAAGVVVADIRHELEELQRRRAAGEIVVSVFGEISAGKSSLIRALLPGTEIAVDVRGGTTREITYYTWTSSAGDRLILADLPGLNEADGSLDRMARDEALRAHVIVYVCEGDLTRDQYQALRTLVDLGSPVIVALNKVDRYSEPDLSLVRERLAERIGEQVEVVPVQCGGVEEVTRIYHDGREETTMRERQPRVEELRRALQRYLDTDPQVLDALRDTAVFVLAQQKLDSAVAEHRRVKAEAIIHSYSRKAVFGALAAVSPGTDVLIQGYLGYNLLKELCALYEAPAREMDMQRFLDLAGNQIKRSLNLLLALVGNVFKAFPGMGTVVGGMIHAVVYGLIFESLGKAVARSLESRGDLVSGPTLRMFEDNLSEDLEARTRRFAQLVWARQRDSNPSGTSSG
ncbi:MAG TPA: Era-like GTP-binding protein [Candidatus Competibacteraceae bacterium]|nr:Era-like GTP-binding protein [Candidatus Competibacteraceae bacterium]HRZ05368.1 Era-like GTP-binding protein [Candidatus Competibacteraceae bacterium]HSA48299.1 Era-like GTP-binding protein [Candidatus Competibacteraceae bacterium]